jgi:tetratricopeptide (TPR) repeat protein
MEDEVTNPWMVDPGMAQALRKRHIQRLLAVEDWPAAVLEAEELLDVNPDDIEALELLAQAQLAMTDAEGAVLAWEQVLSLDATPRADRLAQLALAKLDTCDVVGAVTDAREALRLDPSRADAHFALGLALEYTEGTSTESAQALLAAQNLDPITYPFPMRLNAAGWEQALTTAMLRIPHEIRKLWEGVPVSLSDRPTLEDLAHQAPPMSPRVHGMFLGDPPEHGNPWEHPPDALLLFSDNLARVTHLDALIERIAALLEQEAMVWVGEDMLASEANSE